MRKNMQYAHFAKYAKMLQHAKYAAIACQRKTDMPT